jgi:uncharacterized protein (TIGR02145 family)
MKTNPVFLLLILLVFIVLTSCKEKDIYPDLVKLPVKIDFTDDTVSKGVSGSVADIDSNVYRTMQFGSQLWMIENLKATRYKDGNLIDYVTGGPAGYTKWFDSGKGAYCWYDNDLEVNKELGAIYNWHAVATGKVCPTGWHVPSYEEWAVLINYMGGILSSFDNTSDNAQIYLGDLENNMDVSNFNRGPGGCLHGWGFIDRDCIDCRYWWTATPLIKHNFPYAYIASFQLMSNEPQSYGYNVRCVKD